MTGLRFVIYMLAVYRYTLLLHEEHGPWDIITRFRAWLGLWTEITPTDDEWGEHIITTHVDNELAAMVNCPYCLSGWVAIIAAFGLWRRWRIIEGLAVIGALWAIPHYLYKRLGY